MQLIKDGRRDVDEFTFVGDVADIDDTDGPIFVTAEVWAEARDRLLDRMGPVGLWLRSDQSPEPFAEDIDQFNAVALEFPQFKDGRSYSHARILRDRMDYRGELRAVGNVLRDQLLFMHRCGFDAFAVPAEFSPDDYVAALREFTVWYQPAADTRAPVWQLRHRGRAAE